MQVLFKLRRLGLPSITASKLASPISLYLKIYNLLTGNL